MTTATHSPQPDSLESLAARAQAGDRRSFETLSKQVQGPLRAFLAGRIAQDADADDLAQETLIRAFHNLEKYDPSRPFTTWLYTIGKRLAINHVHSEKRRESRVAASTAHALPVVTTTSHAEHEDIWHRAKRTLTDEAYRAIWLKYARDSSIAEIAIELGRTKISTKVLLHRSRKKLLRSMTRQSPSKKCETQT